MEGYLSFISMDFWNALFALINMLISFWFLKKFAFGPIKKMIDERQQEIDGLYADATSAKEQAQGLQTQYSARLAAAGEEAAQLIQNASKTAQLRSDEIVRSAQADAQAILSKADRDIELGKKKAMNDIKDDISDMALSIAEKIAEKEINANDQQALIASFIDNLGDEV